MAAVSIGKAIHKSLSAAMGDKPHSSITDWVEILSSANYEEDAYEGIPELVDSINLQVGGPTEACRAIRKKLKYGDVHRQLRALTLLKALVENCGQKFQTSLSHDPLLERLKLMAHDSMVDERVKKKLMSVLASWHRQFKDDPRMSIVANLWHAAGGGPQKRASLPPPKPAVDTSRLEEDRKRSEEERKRREEEARERLARKQAELKAQQEERVRAKMEQEKAKAKAKAAAQAQTQPKAKRKPFDMEEEKPKVLASISTASQASNNLVNALKLVNRERETIETNTRVQECLAEAKAARKSVVRYIQLVQDEAFIGTLIDSNERIISALELYDHMLKTADEDSDEEITEGMQQMQMTGGSSTEPELLKLQDKQRIAIERAKQQQSSRQGSTSSGVNQYGFGQSADAPHLHSDLQDLSFGGAAYGGQSYLPPPIRPEAQETREQTAHHGSLSDYSDYESSDEEAHRRAVAASSSANRSYPSGSGTGASKTALIDLSDDPFADPGDEVGTPGITPRKEYVF